MIDNRSRYRDTPGFSADDPQSTAFAGIRPRHVVTLDGAIEHVLQKGERIDLLARHYYGDDRLWWRILDANPQIDYGGSPELDALAGQVILIPGGAS